PADIPARLREIGRLLPRLLVRDRELGAPLLGGLQVLLLAAALLLAARARKPSISALLAVALASVIGIVGLVKIFWPTPRVLTAMGFFWGGVVAVCFRLAPPRAQKIVLALGGLLAFAFAAIDHKAMNEQARLNQHDA